MKVKIGISKTVIFLVSFLLSIASHAQRHDLITIPLGAGMTLLRCDVASGDFKQIEIISFVSGDLALKVVDRANSWQAFSLPRKEWTAKSITIPCWKAAHASCGNLVDEGHNQWAYMITGTTGISSGDCD